MQIEIHSQVSTKEIVPVSLVLSADQNQPTGMKMAHCVRCGEKLVQHQGRIIAIYPGMVPNLKLPLFVKCKNCKEIYAIGSIAF